MKYKNTPVSGAVSALALSSTLYLTIPSDKLQAKIIESTTEDVSEANATKVDISEGGSF